MNPAPSKYSVYYIFLKDKNLNVIYAEFLKRNEQKEGAG
jgi:hypothetical protein